MALRIGAADDRLDPRRDDRRDGAPGAPRGRRRRPRLRRQRRGDLRARERVRRLLHDPAGVRRPALRGRGDHLRTRQLGGAPGGPGRAHHGAWSRVARRRSPTRTTRATGSTANAAPFSLGAASATVADQPSPASRRLGRPRFSWQRRGARLRPPARPRLRPDPAPRRRTAAGRPSTRTSASPCCGRSTRTASTAPVGAAPRPAPRHLPLPDHRQPLQAHLEPVRACSPRGRSRPRRVAAPPARSRSSSATRRPGSKRTSATRRPDASASLTHRPRHAALWPGDLHRRRPAGHRAGRARRPLRGPRGPRRPDRDPGRRRPRRLRQPHRRGFRLSGLSRPGLSGARPGARARAARTARRRRARDPTRRSSGPSARAPGSALAPPGWWRRSDESILVGARRFAGERHPRPA